MAAVQIMVVALCIAACIAAFQVIASLFDGSVHVSRLRVCLAVGLPFVVVKRAFAKRSLDYGGAIASFFVGFVITLHSYAHVSAMVTFFVTSSAFTKFRQHRKRKLEADCKEGGQRTWQQVVCNGGVAVLFALISLVGASEPLLGAERLLSARKGVGFDSASWYDLAVLGSIASAAGDTWASEIGAAVGNNDPWLISNFKRVPKGTNGAVSLVGSLSSVAGGATVGVAYWLTIHLSTASYHEGAVSQPQWTAVIICAICGGIGSVIDSFLGATVQYSGYDVSTNRIVQHPGPGVRRIAGRPWLDNNSVNLFSSFLTALLTPVIAEVVFAVTSG